MGLYSNASVDGYGVKKLDFVHVAGFNINAQIASENSLKVPPKVKASHQLKKYVNSLFETIKTCLCIIKLKSQCKVWDTSLYIFGQGSLQNNILPLVTQHN